MSRRRRPCETCRDGAEAPTASGDSCQHREHAACIALVERSACPARSRHAGARTAGAATCQRSRRGHPSAIDAAELDGEGQIAWTAKGYPELRKRTGRREPTLTKWRCRGWGRGFESRRPLQKRKRTFRQIATSAEEWARFPGGRRAAPAPEPRRGHRRVPVPPRAGPARTFALYILVKAIAVAASSMLGNSGPAARVRGRPGQQSVGTAPEAPDWTTTRKWGVQWDCDCAPLAWSCCSCWGGWRPPPPRRPAPWDRRCPCRFRRSAPADT